MLCSSSGVGKEWDECFSIDFPGTEYDDVILLKQMRGKFAQKGSLKKEPKTIVYALKDSIFSRISLDYAHFYTLFFNFLKVQNTQF